MDIHSSDRYSLCNFSSISCTDHKETVAEHLTGEHDSQFDHEAFLGKSESDKFDQLTPEEARRRLG